MAIAVKNPQYDENQTFLGRFVEYTGSSIGAIRSLSLMRGISRLYNQTVSTPSSTMETLDTTASAGISAIGIVLLPYRTQETYQLVSDLRNSDGTPMQRKVELAMRSSMDTVSAWMSTGAVLTGNPTFRNISVITDFTQDVADLKIAADDYKSTSDYEVFASGEVKEALAHTRKYHLLRIAKATLSIAAALFALLMIFTGVQLLPLVLAILLSLTTTIVAIRRDIFKNEGKFRLIDLNRPLMSLKIS